MLMEAKVRLGTVRLSRRERKLNLGIIFEIYAGGRLLCSEREQIGFIGPGAV